MSLILGELTHNLLKAPRCQGSSGSTNSGAPAVQLAY